MRFGAGLACVLALGLVSVVGASADPGDEGAAGVAPAVAELPDRDRASIKELFALTPEQIERLRDAVQQRRETLLSRDAASPRCRRRQIEVSGAATGDVPVIAVSTGFVTTVAFFNGEGVRRPVEVAMSVDGVRVSEWEHLVHVRPESRQNGSVTVMLLSVGGEKRTITGRMVGDAVVLELGAAVQTVDCWVDVRLSAG